MPRFTLTQMLMGVAMVAILLLFLGIDTRGRPFASIECLSFSRDGSQLAISKLHARDAKIFGKGRIVDFGRTLSIVESAGGVTISTVCDDVVPRKVRTSSPLYKENAIALTFCGPENEFIAAKEWLSEDLALFRRDGRAEPEILLTWEDFVGVARSASGRYLISAGVQQSATGARSKRLDLYDFATGQKGTTPAPRTIATSLARFIAFSRDESKLILGFDNIEVIDIETGKQIATIYNQERPLSSNEVPWTDMRGLAVLPDDTLLVCWSQGVSRYQLSGELISTVPAAGCKSLCATSDGQKMLLLSETALTIMDVETGKTLRTISLLGQTLAASPTEPKVAVGDRGGNVSMYDVNTGVCLWSREAPPLTPPRGYTYWFPGWLLAGWGVVACTLMRWRHGPSNRLTWAMFLVFLYTVGLLMFPPYF